MKNEDDYWFRAREYGYGVGLPLNWKGWALVVALIAAMFIGQELIQHLIPQHDWAIAVALGVIFVIAPMGWLIYRKTERNGSETDCEED